MREFWTLGRRDGRWMLVASSRAPRARTRSTTKIVATPWADETAMRDEALVEGAVADAVPEGTKIAEVADLQFEGDAQRAANDLSLADGRFAPDVLEIAARRAVDGLGAGGRRRRRRPARGGHAGRGPRAAVRRGHRAARCGWSSAARRSTGSGSSRSTPPPSRRR